METRRNELSERIQELEDATEAMDETIETRGKTSRDPSSCRAKLGTTEKEMATLNGEIGRFVTPTPHMKAARPQQGITGDSSTRSPLCAIRWP